MAEETENKENKPKDLKKIEKTGPSKLVILASGLGVLLFIVLVVAAVYAIQQGGGENETAKTTAQKETPPEVEKETNISQRPQPSEEDKEKFKDWQTHDNAALGLYFRVPPGWTKTETANGYHIELFGPSTGGGVILYECVFTVFIEDVPAETELDDYVNAAAAAPMAAGTVVEDVASSVSENPARKIQDTYFDVGTAFKRMRVWTLKNNRVYTFTFYASTNYGSTDYYTIHAPTADMILGSVILD